MEVKGRPFRPRWDRTVSPSSSAPTAWENLRTPTLSSVLPTLTTSSASPAARLPFRNKEMRPTAPVETGARCKGRLCLGLSCKRRLRPYCRRRLDLLLKTRNEKNKEYSKVCKISKASECNKPSGKI